MDQNRERNLKDYPVKKAITNCSHTSAIYGGLGLCKVCYWSQYYEKHQIQIKAKATLRRKANPKTRMLIDARRRAKRDGVMFDLFEEDIHIPSVCPALGISLNLNNKPGCPDSPSLDRIDNSKGYLKSNVIVVSNRANSIKRDATITELIALTNFYKTVQEISKTVQ